MAGVGDVQLRMRPVLRALQPVSLGTRDRFWLLSGAEMGPSALQSGFWPQSLVKMPPSGLFAGMVTGLTAQEGPGKPEVLGPRVSP